MYLRTPKRYRSGRRRHLRLISRRTVFFLMLIPLVGWIGWLAWNNQAQLRSSLLPKLEDLAANVQTQVAPRPTPSPTPDLALAQLGCDAAYQQGDFEKAIQECTILAENRPNDVLLYYRVTHTLVITSNRGRDTERLGQALNFAYKAINANPEAPHGWAILAMVLDWSGKDGEALAAALHARALDDQFAPAYSFLGKIYHDLGRDDLAVGYLDQALQLDTSGLAVADTFRSQGKILSDQGLWEDAIQPYQAAWQQAPTQTYIAIELAENYMALEQIDTAIQVLSAALEKNPNDPGVLWTLARAHVRNGSKERGYEYYLRCLDVDPDNVLCLSYLGGLQYYEGDLVSAISNLQRALELGSDDPDDFLQIGSAYALQGRCDLALPYLQEGYQRVTADQNFDKQAGFATELQNCGAPVSQSSTASTPLPPAAQ